MSAMSILLFYSVANSSFICLIMPFELQIRMKRDFDIATLVGIFGFNKG